uniref:Immunoglobulin-binding protein 1 n=1 Tax=Parastrongyloides trichosuri TaxID=131310 RepID=A0A0N4ZUN1_PARTI
MSQNNSICIRDVFIKYRDLILNEDGKFSDKQEILKKSIEEMTQLRTDIDSMNLISLNEGLDEIAANDLEMFLLPYLLATAYYNIKETDPEKRMKVLFETKLNMQNYLEQLHLFSIINFVLPWLKEVDEISGQSSINCNEKLTPGEKRERIIKRHNMYNRLEEKLKEYEREMITNGSSDDQAQRKYVIEKLRMYSIKAMTDLEKIDDEVEILKHIIKVKKGEVEEEKYRPAQKLKPYRIVRDELQKKVLGLGYQSIPTLTVDQWYKEMDKKGHFNVQHVTGNESKKDESDEELNEEEEEEKRQKQISWDEYTDCHRSGWGNTYNRG